MSLMSQSPRGKILNVTNVTIPRREDIKCHNPQEERYAYKLNVLRRKDMPELESESFQPILRLLNLLSSRHCNSDPGGEKTEMQKVADPADISVLFFSAGANF